MLLPVRCLEALLGLLHAVAAQGIDRGGGEVEGPAFASLRCAEAPPCQTILCLATPILTATGTRSYTIGRRSRPQLEPSWNPKCGVSVYGLVQHCRKRLIYGVSVRLRIVANAPTKTKA